MKGLAKTLTTAALALPGVAASLPAAAQTAPPERITMGMKWLEYQDYGGNDTLMGIRAPYAYVEAPLGEHWGIEASVLIDTIAGATPLAQAAPAPAGTTDTTSSASGRPSRNAVSTLLGAVAADLETAASGLSGDTADVTDRRFGFDTKATYYFDRGAAGFGFAFSEESDWTSLAGSADVRLSTADNNRTYALGIGFTHDNVRSVADATLNEHRATWEAMAGMTQVISQTQLVQSNITLSYGSGFYDDVYRTGDARPGERLAAAWLTRYRHYVPAFDAAIHADYRLFADDWGMVGHTVEIAWYQPLGDTWLVRPFLRYHSQDHADFYSSAPAPYAWTSEFSNDPRLGSFGALAPGVVVEKSFDDGWTLQFHAEYYERKGAWHMTSDGSDGLEGLKAFVFIMGVRKTF